MKNINVINLGKQRFYIPNLGVVQAPKRIYWVRVGDHCHWRVNPIRCSSKCFTVQGNEDAAIQYQEAIRHLHSEDPILRRARLFERRERRSKVSHTGMAGVFVYRAGWKMPSGRVIPTTVVKVKGFGILPDKVWYVLLDDKVGDYIQRALDYRERCFDLWCDLYEITVEDAVTAIG